MIPLVEAQRVVLEACPPLAPVAMARADALGLVLAADVAAAEDVPPFANSAVDGYAVRAVDVDRRRPSTCGWSPRWRPVRPRRRTCSRAGEAIRIMTGAPVPPGADAVVMVEDTERLDDGARVRVRTVPTEGDAVRPAGSDVATGTVVFTTGTVVTPAVAGVLASINAATVTAQPAARVGLLSTGDELVSDGGPLGAGADPRVEPGDARAAAGGGRGAPCARTG